MSDTETEDRGPAAEDGDVASYSPHDTIAQPAHHTAWAAIVDNIVQRIRVVASHLPHPFDEHVANGGRVVNVTSVPCAVGYVVDTHGNVAPPATPRADGTMAAPHMPAPGEMAATVQAVPPPVPEQPGINQEIAQRQAEEAEHHDDASVTETRGGAAEVERHDAP